MLADEDAMVSLSWVPLSWVSSSSGIVISVFSDLAERLEELVAALSSELRWRLRLVMGSRLDMVDDEND